MLSSVSFKWVFNRSLPLVSYLTLLDEYSISGIAYITLLAAWYAFIGVYYEILNNSIDLWILAGFAFRFFLGHIRFF